MYVHVAGRDFSARGANVFGDGKARGACSVYYASSDPSYKCSAVVNLR